MDAKTIAKLVAQLDLPRPQKDLSNNMVPSRRYMTCEIEGVGEVVVILHEFGVAVDFWPCKNSSAKLKSATQIGWLPYSEAGVYVLDESHDEWATYPPREEEVDSESEPTAIVYCSKCGWRILRHVESHVMLAPERFLCWSCYQQQQGE